MHKPQAPIVNTWYTNLTGQLFKIKLVVHGRQGVTTVVIQYLDGTKNVITREEWECLRLIQHAARQAKQGKASEVGEVR